MIHFGSDYRQSAHLKVLEKLMQHQREQHGGYGQDAWCQRAEARVRALTGQPQAALHFVPGGTQANLTVISSILRPHQGVVAVDSGHISVHETGAIEATGHKVLVLPAHQGKMRAEDLWALLEAHLNDPNREHDVQPGMVYLSQSTEWGTVYSKSELAAIRALCLAHDLPLYIDGARLGYALTSQGNDMTMRDVAGLCDAFTIGLTKQGALFGEAIVLCAPGLQRDFRYLIKQRGGMMAKGWLMGLQFEALFEEELYLELAGEAVAQALRLRAGLLALGLHSYVDSPSNQQFFVFPQAALDKLAGRFGWAPILALPDNRQVIRLCTSWATGPEDIDSLLAAVRQAL